MLQHLWEFLSRPKRDERIRIPVTVLRDTSNAKQICASARGTHCDIIRYHKRRSWPSSPLALTVHLAGCNPAGNDISGIRSNAKRHFHGGDSILNTAHWDSIDAHEEENIIWHPIYCFVMNVEETSFGEKWLRSSIAI